MLLVLALFACRGCATEPAVTDFDPRDHFAAVLDARDAVVGGELAAMAEAGRAIDATLPTELPADARDAVDAIHGAAGFLVVAEDTVEGADAVARMGEACGACHRAMGRSFTTEQLRDGLVLPEHHAADADLAWAALLAGDAQALSASLERLARLDGGEAEPGRDGYAAALGRCAPCHAAQGVTIKRRPGSP